MNFSILMNNNRYLIVYHQEDNDGIISGAMFYDYILNRHAEPAKKENIVLAPSTYATINKNLKLDEGDDYINSFDVVVFTDISMNDVKKFKSILKNENFGTIWVDHHKPIIDVVSMDKTFDDVHGIRDTKHSALYNMFVYLYGKEKYMPQIYKILSAWDSWSYEAEGISKEFADIINKAITAKLELNFEKAVEFVKEQEKDPLDKKHKIFDQYWYEGKAIVSYLNTCNNEMIRTYGDFGWRVGSNSSLNNDKHNKANAIALFTQGQTNSLMFEQYKDKYEHGIVFKKLPNYTYAISLYNLNDDSEFDCGAYLKEKYNGGGHKGAAGCTVPVEVVDEMLITKTI